MSRKEALVVPVKLEKHGNADSLSLVKIGGWQCVVRTADWQNVDKGIYVEPDTLVDIRKPEFKFLDSGKDRSHECIKVKKLRGEYSQGLLIPAPSNAKIGENFWDRLSLERYEPPEIISRPGGSIKSGEEAKAPSGYFPVYDVESWQKYGKLFQDGEEIYATEKIHGCNFRALWQNNRLHVGSRNKWKKPLNPTIAMSDNFWTKIYNKFFLFKRKFSKRRNWQESTWWNVIENNKWIKEFCQMHEGLALYGELHGHVQDLKYGYGPHEYAIRIFDIWDGNKFLNYDEAFKLLDIKYWCPIVYKGPYSEYIIRELAEQDSLLAKEKGVNQLGEGIVIRPEFSRFEQKLNGRLVLKLVSNRYLER